MKEFSNHIKVKDDLINFLREETIGPDDKNDENKGPQKLRDSPKSVFSSGMLFPKNILINEDDNLKVSILLLSTNNI